LLQILELAARFRKAELMFSRQLLAVLLVLMLAFPAWASPNIVGNVSSSESATVRGTNLTPGSTILSGDAIEVGARGSAQILLVGGAQLRMLEDSQVRVTRTTDVIQVSVQRGVASFRTAENSSVEALLADATIRSADRLPAVGIISVRSPQSAMIAAEKGTLLITTAHDSKSVTLHEGDAAEVTLVPEKAKDRDKDKGGGAVPAGASSAARVVLIAIIVGGAITAAALLLGRGGTQLTTQQKCNSVSPFRCP
jgi:hypothetical protein